MPVAVIRSEKGLEYAAGLIRAKGFPVMVSWQAGEPTRRDRQNRLAQRWFTDIATQRGDMTHEEARAMCKLHFGVPILREENEAFRASYDAVMKHLPYEAKLQAIQAFDMPITRLMSVKQMTRFMDDMGAYWRKEGVRLTDPEALKYQEYE